MLLALALVAADSPLVGAWGIQGETVCELRADGTGVCDDPFRWQANEKTIVVTAEGGVRRIPYHLTKDRLVITFDGVPVTLSRLTKAKAGAKKTSVEKDVRSRRLRQLLLSSAWCTFRYKSGFGQQARVVFRGNGTWQSALKSSTYSTGTGGQYYSEGDQLDGGRWDIRGGALFMSSSENPELEQLDLEVSQNSNGWPIIKADRKEYSSCD